MILANQTNAQIKIGANGSKIAPASILELESTNQGLLLPRLADTIAINKLNPPGGMLIYLTKAPGTGLYIRRDSGWEYLTGFPGGNASFNSVTISGIATAGSFKGPLTGNASSATTAVTATNAGNSAITNDLSTTAVTYPTFVTATPGNLPLKTSSTRLSFVPATGILSATQFKGDLTGNVTGTATLAIDAQNAANTSISNDLTTNSIHYPTFVSGITGNLLQKTSSDNLSYVPQTGILTAKGFKGPLIGNATNVSGIVLPVNGGTGQAGFTKGDILYATGPTTMAKLPVGAAGQTLGVGAGNLPVWQNSGTDTITNLGTITKGVWNGTPVSVPSGGTGVSSLATGVLISAGTGPISTISGTAGQVLTSNGSGTAPSFQSTSAGDMFLNTAQTVNGTKTFGSAGSVGKLILAGNTSGLTTLNGPASGIGGTVVLPATGTLATLSGTETLSNKTLTAPNIGAATGTSLTVGSGNVTAGSFTGALTGNASSATTLQTARTINGVSFNGSANITIADATKVAANTAITGATKTKITYDTKGLVTAGADATTADIAASVNKNYVNDAQLAIIANTSGTNTGDQTNITGNAGTATALQSARTIGGTSFDGTGNITVASATGGFTVSGGDLALNSNNITMNGSLGTTGTRLTKGWFNDLQVTNPIAGSITGNAGTATALQNARTIGGTSFDGTGNITVASATGGFSVTGGDLALSTNNITMSGSLGTTGTRLTKGWFTDLQVTNPIAGSITGNGATATSLQTARTINGISFDGSANITVPANLTGAVTSDGSNVTTIPLATGRMLIGNASNAAQGVIVDGDLTLAVNPFTSTLTVSIDEGAVTNAVLDNMPPQTIKGNNDGDGDPEDLDADQVKALLGPTGTGNLVLATSPTLISPVLGAATGTSLALGGGTALATTNRTGTGNLVLENTPTFITPVLGAATGTSLALGGGTALTTTNRTGTGNLVLATSPTLSTPTLGIATATSINGNAITTGTGTLTLGAGSTLATSATNSITLTSTGTTTVILPTSGTLYGTATGTISSTQLRTSLTDDTGTGATVFANTPTLTTPELGDATATTINAVTITNPGTAATLTLANGSSLITAGSNPITLTSVGATNVTLPTTGTLVAALSATAPLNFPSTGVGLSSDLTIAVPGAVDGDVVSIGVSNTSTLSNGVFSAWVSAADTVKVRFSNNDLISSLDPLSGTFKVKVFK